MHPFRTTFGIDAAASASAPGRVNMLGEHTDSLLEELCGVGPDALKRMHGDGVI